MTSQLLAFSKPIEQQKIDFDFIVRLSIDKKPLFDRQFVAKYSSKIYIEELGVEDKNIILGIGIRGPECSRDFHQTLLDSLRELTCINTVHTVHNNRLFTVL